MFRHLPACRCASICKPCKLLLRPAHSTPASKHANPLNTSIRNDDHLDVTIHSVNPLQHTSIVLVLRIRPRLLRRQNLRPHLTLVLGNLLARRRSENLHLLREVAPEVRRVDDQLLDHARRAELDDRPVDVLAARTLRLPAVAHVDAAAGQQQVGDAAEVLVGALDGDAAVDGGREVEDRVGVLRQHGDDGAEEAEARDAAVGEHLQAHVGVCLVCAGRQDPAVSLARAAFLFWQDSLPAGEVLALDLLLFVVGREAALHGDLGRLVAVEEGCVDFDALDFAGGDAEAEDYPVERLCVVSSCLPAIIPCSRVGEDAWLADGLFGVVEVLGGGEPFVGEGKDARSEIPVYEVLWCQVIAKMIVHV